MLRFASAKLEFFSETDKFEQPFLQISEKIL
jgi:hypothetical protein